MMGTMSNSRSLKCVVAHALTYGRNVRELSNGVVGLAEILAKDAGVVSSQFRQLVRR